MQREVMEQNAAALAEKDKHLEKMRSTNNLLLKALHYRNAFAAFEKVLSAPTMSQIPDNEVDVMELAPGLLVVPEGSIYRKGNGRIGPSSIKLGTITLTPQEPPNLDKLHP